MSQNKNESKKNYLNIAIDGLSGIFLPIVNILSAAGILKGIIATLTAAGVLTVASGNYEILTAMGDALFYFFPILLAATSAKKFGANQYTAIVIACILLYPKLTAVFESGSAISFLGIPVTPVNYMYSVIPIIFAVGVQLYVEKFLDKLIPNLIKGFLAPLLTMIIVGSISLWLLGPVGKVIGDVLANGYGLMYNFSPVVAGVLLGTTIQLMVVFGFHWSIIPIAMSNIALNGSDTILAFIAPAVFAQAGAAMGVFFKSKDKHLKTIAVSAAISSCFGVTEPAMFGINLPLKKPMIAVCISGGIGGAIVGISGARAMAFAFPGIATIPIFIGKGFLLFLVACLSGVIVAFVLTLLFKFDANINTVEQIHKK